MELDIDSEFSLESSDADPQLVVSTLKNIDDLDADLFDKSKKKPALSKTKRTTNTKTQKKTGKTVSFKASDSDSYNDSFSKKKSAVSSKSDDLFGDDNDDILLTLGIEDETPKTTSFAKPESDQASIDQLSSPTTSLQPKQQANAVKKSQKYSFDKEGNLVTDKFLPASEDVSFGSYQPSYTSTRSRLRRIGTPLTKKEDPFVDLFDQDSAAPLKNTSSTTEKEIEPKLSPTKRSRNLDFLQLGDEIDLDALSLNTEKLPAVQPVQSKKKTLSTETKQEKEISAVSPVAEPAVSSIIQLPPGNVIPPDVQTTNHSFIHSMQANSTTDYTSTVQSLKLDEKLNDSKPSSNCLQPTVHGSVMVPTDSFQANLIKQNDAVVRDLKVGFQTDLEMIKQAYQGRIQCLHATISDIQSRSEREIESIKESYKVRLEAVRSQVREQIQEVVKRDLAEQEEVKKLRSLHLTALEETRLDYEDRIRRIMDAHSKDMDNLKSSTIYVRNFDDMVQKVNDASQQMETLSAKYEASFNSVNQKWNEVASENKRFMALVQGRLDEIYQSNIEMQTNLKQTVSRLEGNLSEINQSLQEQKYQMQLQLNRLENAQVSVEKERRQLLQQVGKEREEAMKVHREAIELRQSHQQQMRVENEKLRQREDHLLHSHQVMENSQAAELKQAMDREKDRRRIENELAKERAAVTEKMERLASLEARLQTQQEELEQRQQLLDNQERQTAENIRNWKNETRIAEDRSSKKLEESISVLQKAKEVEESHKRRLNEIHLHENALATQRQLLAEDRKQMFQGSVNYEPVQYTSLTPKSKLLINKDFTSPINKISQANTALWAITAEKDHDFLEDEEIFLETLQNSPHRISQCTS